MRWLPKFLPHVCLLCALYHMQIQRHGLWVLKDVAHAAASALQFFQQGIANWRELKSWGFKGWDFTSSPCQGWSGVSCDAAGRVSKL